MSADHAVTRRSLLAGAAGTTAAAVLAGPVPALARQSHRRTPLWETAFRRGLIYGASTSTWMYEDDPAYAALLQREAAMIWTEDDVLWYHVKPTPTAPLDFSFGDRIVEFAERNGQLVFGAPGLVWDEGFGEGWTDDFLWSMDRRTAEGILYPTVRATVRHYRGRVAAWVVCNEVTDPEGVRGVRTDVPWYNAIGDSYIAESFRIAHDADHDALLVLNEFGLVAANELDEPAEPRQKAVLEVLRNLVRHDVPVQALGIEGHLLAANFVQTFHPRRFREFMRRVADLGLKILITEMDVLDNGLPAAIKPRDRGVAEVYARFLDTALEEEAVISLISYGLSDRWSEEQWDNPRDDGLLPRDTPFDDALEPKPAFYALQHALAHEPRRHPYWVPPRARRGH